MQDYQQQFREAIQLTHNNQHVEARELLLSLGDLLPADNREAQIQYWALLGNLYLHLRQLEMAEAALGKSLALDPRDSASLNDLAAVYNLTQRHQEAIPLLRNSLEIAPGQLPAMMNLAIALCETENYSEAITLAITCLQYESKPTRLHTLLGRCYLELGDAEMAIRHYEEAIRIDSHFCMAYHDLAFSKKFTSTNGPEFITRVEKLLLGNITTADKIYLYFALGKANDDLKQWDAAFRHYARGNTLKKTTLPEPIPPYEVLEASRLLFTPAMYQHAFEAASSSAVPIFIVGMPRSGSTLIDQIITAHSHCSSVGESRQFTELLAKTCHQQSLQQQQNALLNPQTDNRFGKLAEDYLACLTTKHPGAERVVDKQLFNYMYVGLIALLFPQAKILHTYRHPIDTCLSCYFQDFKFINWSYDMAWIAEHYIFYRNMMAYWKTVLPPGRLIEVNYEAVVDNPEAEMRSLMDKLGLDWEPACLTFHQQKRAIRTASLWQVHQPIYKASQQRWKHYARHLGPLVERLSSYIDPADQAFVSAAISGKQPSLAAKVGRFFGLSPKTP